MNSRCHAKMMAVFLILMCASSILASALPYDNDYYSSEGEYEDRFPAYKRHMRSLDFGFAGLDNFDFIHRMLNQKSPSSSDVQRKKQRLTELMELHG